LFKFKEAIVIANNPILTKNENKMIFAIKNINIPIDYISPAWNGINNLTNIVGKFFYKSNK